MRLFTFTASAWIVLGAMAMTAKPAAAAMIVDNFETYTDGELLANGAHSTPWLRFGNGVNDQLYATGDPSYVIDGQFSAHIAATWGSDGPNINMRRNFVSATDLSAYNTASIKMRTQAASTTAQVMLAFSDGTGTYTSNQSYALSGAPQTFTFTLDPAHMTLTDGSGSFATVLSQVTSLGVRVINTKGQPNETLVLDDFVLDYNPVPEPAAGALVIGGLAALSTRRRRLQ